MYNKYAERPNKQHHVRQLGKQAKQLLGKVKTALTLPSTTFLSEDVFLDEGLFGKSTHVFAAEKEASLREQVRQGLAKRFTDNRRKSQNFDLFPGNLEAMPIPSKPVQFAFADFCGTFNPSVAQWVDGKLPDILDDESVVVFTFYRAYRSQKKWATMFHYPDFYHEGKAGEAINYKLHEEFCHSGFHESQAAKYENEIDAKPIDLLIAFANFATLFHYWKRVEIMDCIQYNDTKQHKGPGMLLLAFHLKDRRHKPKGKSLLWHALEQIGYESRRPQVNRPKHLSPQQWAWHPDNPNGIRTETYLDAKQTYIDTLKAAIEKLDEQRERIIKELEALETP